MRSAKRRRPRSISISRCRPPDRLNMLQANYFDGRSTRVRLVDLSVVGEDLVIAGEGIDFRVPFIDVKVDERLGRAPRRLRFHGRHILRSTRPGCARYPVIVTAHRDGWVDRMQRHLQFVLFAPLRVWRLLPQRTNGACPGRPPGRTASSAGYRKNAIRADAETFGRQDSSCPARSPRNASRR